MSDETALLERTRNILIAAPYMGFADAKAQATRQLRDEELDTLISAGEAEEREWRASGQSLDSFFDQTWRANVAADADRVGIPSGSSDELMVSLETQFAAGSSGLNQGGFTQEQKDNLAKHWAKTESDDLAARRKAGLIGGQG
jgi:hypothetical protein